ncbi:MAG: hypothetical protein ACYCW6_22045 [Candidatus Xenobia bacterium]
MPDVKRRHYKPRPAPPPPVPQDVRNLGREVTAAAGLVVESSARARLLDSFVQCPHGHLAGYQALHLEALQRDPLFYAPLARWCREHGAVRDHNELFAAHLICSPFPDHREHGEVLLQYLRPYQVVNVIDYCKRVLHFTPRRLRTAVQFYLLRRRESDTAWFDEHVMRNKHAMKRLYASLHIAPSERAETILFAERPPTGSRLAAVQELARLGTQPAEQARLILQHHIHFTTALGTIKAFTPCLLYALISVMTPQQAINNLAFLQKRGCLELAETRQALNLRLQTAIREGRVSDMKTRVALSQLPSVDHSLADSLLRITQKRLRNRGRLTEPTALLVDKSGSMQACIEIGKLLATMCSTIADADLWVYAFDSHAFRIEPSDRSFPAWERAFSRIIADGATSIGAGLVPLMNARVRQVVVITDGEENQDPYFAEVLRPTWSSTPSTTTPPAAWCSRSVGRGAFPSCISGSAAMATARCGGTKAIGCHRTGRPIRAPIRSPASSRCWSWWPRWRASKRGRQPAPGGRGR